MDAEDAKRAARERAWDALQAAGAARFPGARGRVPNFTGAEAAAERLASLEVWRRARVIKSNPDSPQLPVRARALAEGKVVYLAVPKLVSAKPFLRLDPERLRVRPRAAASIKGASVHGEPAGVDDVGHVDVIVCGSVAVNRRGVRVGKGGGYSDLEFALLTESGAVDADTWITTTVHGSQLFDEELPETGHDFRVDWIVTPDEVIHPRRARRPPGILWGDLPPEKAAAIPAIARLTRPST